MVDSAALTDQIPSAPGPDDLTTVTPPALTDGRSPALAAFLSFLWPGLGQWYAGRTRIAAILALPVLAIALYLLFLASHGIEALGADLLVPGFALALIALAVVLGAWRLFAIGHAYAVTAPSARPMRTRGAVIIAVLAAIVVLSHALVGYYAWAFYDAGSRIFVGAEPISTPAPSQSPVDSSGPGGAAGNYAGGPDVTPATPTSRINILMTGIDAYRTRSEALNDTLLVISLDPATKTAVMISIPRDTSYFRLYSGGTYTGKINSLMTAAYLSPTRYPDGPIRTLTREVGYLLGIPIHYYAAIDLAGFRRMIDLVGGVDVVNPQPIQDPLYDWLDGSSNGFYLTAGPHHLNGRLALAYVRSRQGQGDSDYSRAARQQQVLVALKQKMIQPAMLTKLPALLDAAAQTIKTDFPPDRVSDMIDIGKALPNSAIQKFVLGPPYNYHPDSSTTGGVWTSRLYMDKVAALSVQLFGADSAYYTPPASPSPIASP
jgi:polyisoprenyl-teichoic acid--peptidoglycan teichoic acid transferase